MINKTIFKKYSYLFLFILFGLFWFSSDLPTANAQQLLGSCPLNFYDSSPAIWTVAGATATGSTNCSIPAGSVSALVVVSSIDDGGTVYINGAVVATYGLTSVGPPTCSLKSGTTPISVTPSSAGGIDFSITSVNCGAGGTGADARINFYGPSGEACGNRNLIGNSDVFWGNPPSLDNSQLSPRPYSDVNQVGPGLVRLSLEGEFPEGCTNVFVQFEIYPDGSTTPIMTVSGNLSAGSSIISGNLGSWQWYVDWNHTLPDGRYRFRAIQLGTTAISSFISTNVLVLTGSTVPPPPPPPPPTLAVSISANPTNGISPLFSTITANVSGTATGSIDYNFYCFLPGNPSPQYSFTSSNISESRLCSYSPAGSYTVRVEVIRQGVLASDTTTVTVNPPLASCAISFSPIGIVLGQTSIATWTSANDADGVLDYTCTGNIGFGTTAANGSIVTTPTTTQTCTMTAVNITGTPATCTAGVTVTTPAPTVNISANSGSIAYNSSTALTWSSSNATSCTASGGWSGAQPLSGTQSTGNLTSNQTYTLTCTGPGGSTSASTTVVVGSPPALVCSPALQSNILINAPVSFSVSGGIGSYTWSAPGGSPSSGSGQNFSSAFGTSGLKTVAVTSGAQSASCQVDVAALPPTSSITCNGSADICEINYNDSATINWACSNSVSGVITNSRTSGVFNGLTGSQTIPGMTTTTIYALTCTNSSGATQTRNVEVNVPIPVPPVALITCDGQTGSCQANSAGSAVIGWVCANSASGTVTNNVSASTWFGVRGYQVLNGLSGTTIYSLICLGAGGTATDQVQVDTAGGPGAQSIIEFFFRIPNPFSGEIDTLDDLFNAAVLFLYYIAGPIVVIMIILAGLLFLFGRGEPSKVNAAKKILLYAVIGLVIILIGQGFIALLKNIIDLGN